MRHIIRKIDKMENKIKKENFKWKPNEISRYAVFISSEPCGRVFGRFDSLDKAKEEAKRVSRDLDIPDLSWLFELPDSDDENVQAKPPFFVVVGEVKSWIEEVG